MGRLTRKIFRPLQKCFSHCRNFPPLCKFFTYLENFCLLSKYFSDFKIFSPTIKILVHYQNSSPTLKIFRPRSNFLPTLKMSPSENFSRTLKMSPSSPFFPLSLAEYFSLMWNISRCPSMPPYTALWHRLATDGPTCWIQPNKSGEVGPCVLVSNTVYLTISCRAKVDRSSTFVLQVGRDQVRWKSQSADPGRGGAAPTFSCWSKLR